ncbi:DUF1513 domain-containing protein [Paracoccus benzoatiresistens]|uniref:DUF1513 domain-containing protein n=1 Tax=Paracoccus benzoatiresistens TaxID=2997341 RepID=A0ABT4J5M6_9RHOB|nr:DUF1513 domain-containing protein [Paracoccus sp. EF6]MCZ0962371.1 DUF1513 domain-containing protein [Paracoccus sp. EF6]
MTDRRTLLKGLAAAAILPGRGWAAAGSPEWLAAARAADGSYALYGLDTGGGLVFAVPLPSRGHAAAAHPARAEAVAFARRPGTYALILDCRTGAVSGRLAPPRGLQFNGHGAFSPDGARLYTSEVVAKGSAGRIGIWDATRGYARLGDMDSHGIGPHELRTRADGAVVVANGGIETDPQDRTPLNLDRMRPNLAVLSAGGSLLSRSELAPELHQNSIRHLALLPAGVAFAMQWQGDPAEPIPLLGIMGQEMRLADAPEEEAMAMQGYAGSIAVSGGLIAVTSPRGGVVMIHGVDGTHRATLRRADICGVAAASDAPFALTDGGGAVWAADGTALRLRARHDLAWDNHLVRIG